MPLTPLGNAYRLRTISFPPSILAACVMLEDGSYDVFVNDCLSLELARKALEHETRHIDGGHLTNDILTVHDLERAAVGLPPEQLPDVFLDHPPGTLPCFSSLEAFYSYMLAAGEQKKQDHGPA